ncbi:ABC transporter permease [Kribbella sp. NBC_01245]|uniref:ABC transporter permease n=1 Tax=Kribbella sp. NBC_01245 TaxID=2903578 RepID=UPI002E2E5A68|nr:ABC transporter permease [Kribbella sp. NBC_01245]
MTSSVEVVDSAAAPPPRAKPVRGRGSSWRYFARRIRFYLVATWVAITLNFFIPRLMPGDPAGAIIENLRRTQAVSAEQVRAIQRLFGGSGDPLWQQYFGYLKQLAQGDFGISTAFYPTPVSQVIGSGIWWTLGLVGTTTILAFALGTGLGILAGRKPGKGFDAIAAPLSTFIGALPFFAVAQLLQLFLAGKLGWFPDIHGYDVDNLVPAFDIYFIPSVIHHALLPAFTIIAGSIGGWLLGMRNMMITTISEDYVLLAEAKGLSPRRVMTQYAARNAILPSVTGLAVSLGFVVGGSLLAEVVFAYPGVGYLFYQSVTSVDYQLMQALFLIISLSVLAANFIADSVYGLIDPRAREDV